MSFTSPQAVLFDLDDTLYDHLHSARHGLVELSHRHPAMQGVSVRELEERYSEALESIHKRLLRGEVTQTEARTARMQQLFGSFNLDIDAETAISEYQQFRRDYDSACQVVNGTHALLDHLRTMGVRLAVVTNNLVSEQVPKLKQLDLDRYFEVVSISEAVGVAKPDPYIFEITLQKLSLKNDQVVMVGDSLSSDIAGATAANIRSVWLNRRPDVQSNAPEASATILSDFADLDHAVKLIVSAG